MQHGPHFSSSSSTSPSTSPPAKLTRPKNTDGQDFPLRLCAAQTFFFTFRPSTLAFSSPLAFLFHLALISVVATLRCFGRRRRDPVAILSVPIAPLGLTQPHPFLTRLLRSRYHTATQSNPLSTSRWRLLYQDFLFWAHSRTCCLPLCTQPETAHEDGHVCYLVHPRRHHVSRQRGLRPINQRNRKEVAADRVFGRRFLVDFALRSIPSRLSSHLAMPQREKSQSSCVTANTHPSTAVQSANKRHAARTVVRTSSPWSDPPE